MNHAKYKAALEHMSENLDLPITKIIERLDGAGVAPPGRVVSAGQLRQAYESLTGEKYVPGGRPYPAEWMLDADRLFADLEASFIQV